MTFISPDDPFIFNLHNIHYHTVNRSSPRPKDLLLSQLANGIILKQNDQTSLTVKQISTREIRPISEAGTRQIKVFVQNGQLTTFGRLKPLKSINEALIYHKMMKANDPLLKHTPKFLGVLDRNGNPINLEKETEENIYEKYHPTYLLLEDLTKELGEGTVLDGNPKDFKFAKKSLLGNDEESQKHGHTVHGSVFKWIREKFFKLSGCAFAYQEATRGGWHLWIINIFKRFLTVSNTKNILKEQFLKMGEEELQANIQKLKDFKDHFSQSKFTFSDSSLLFIPVKKIVNGIEKRDIEIRLIDLSHGMAEDEKMTGFNQMKKDMIDSIQELIDLMASIQAQQSLEAS